VAGTEFTQAHRKDTTHRARDWRDRAPGRDLSG